METSAAVDADPRHALPRRLRVVWFCSAPFALMFAIRIAWEKTVWTWMRGPQRVGFSLRHLYPEMFLIGVVATLIISAWAICAGGYLIARRKKITTGDVAMSATALFVILSAITPDRFFAR